MSPKIPNPGVPVIDELDEQVVRLTAEIRSRQGNLRAYRHMIEIYLERQDSEEFQRYTDVEKLLHFQALVRFYTNILRNEAIVADLQADLARLV